VAERTATPYFPAEREDLPMQSENKMFDDFVKMVNGFAGTFAGMGREAESGAREKFKEWMGGADFVGRDEFEAVKAMAAAARDENDILKARVAALEAKVAGPAPATAKRGVGKKAGPGA
jgi:BMFP domain-containing protein YqiC